LEVPQGQATPRFYNLEFPTYDGAVDPLNWLNQCEQFFRGQRTLASYRTWLASYHLTGAAQTWYFAIEQDEGMPTWDHFKELCHLQFGPAVRGSRLGNSDGSSSRRPSRITPTASTWCCAMRGTSTPSRKLSYLWEASLITYG
jgi:hypothetical protein